MRVIAGKARRLLLKTTPGQDTRPTTDRLKETLFNMLNPRLPDCLFLDLFSGSGAIGIEALSRGARQAVFVEQNLEAAECIRGNLQATKLAQSALVMNCDVLSGLSRLEGKYCFDLIFLDPPYGLEWEKKVLTYLSSSKLTHKDTLLVVEASLHTEFSWLSSLGFFLEKEKTYKTNKHVFIRKNEEETQ